LPEGEGLPAVAGGWAEREKQARKAGRISKRQALHLGGIIFIIFNRIELIYVLLFNLNSLQVI
jgi:hypothetical protein